jgi:L,D-peptidoglycan transpeptidase YkuD (ErfK/YbiS/YcfS/YnhG family)
VEKRLNPSRRIVAPGGLRRLRVVVRAGCKWEATLFAGTLALPCVLGPAGLTRRKREGDGATPTGTFALVSCFYRADRGPRPRSAMPARPCRIDDGWCDDPGASRYNQPVRLPFPGSHERMWRQDQLYDLGLVIDYNLHPAHKGRGSAIFMHIMSPGKTPTAGCIALRPDDLRRLLPRLTPGCLITIQ